MSEIPNIVPLQQSEVPRESRVMIPNPPYPGQELVDYSFAYAHEPKPLEGRMYEIDN